MDPDGVGAPGQCGLLFYISVNYFYMAENYLKIFIYLDSLIFS